MKSRLIPARFPGKCRTCGAAVAKGDSCWFAKHFGIRCASCGAHTDSDLPLPSKRRAKAGAGVGRPRKTRPSPELPSQSKPLPPLRDGRFRPLDESAGFRSQDRAVGADSDGVHRLEYGSVQEMVAEAFSDHAQSDHNRERIRGLQAHTLTGTDKWANYYTRERILEQVFDPPAELGQAVEDLRAKLVSVLEMPSRPRRKIRRGQDWGDELDLDRVTQRDAQPWERIFREPEPRRTVQIGINVGAVAYQTPEELLYRGAAALALADLLTAQGCNVGITLLKATADVTSRVYMGVIRCVLKAPDMPLDLQALTFALCEIAFMRCVIVPASARRWTGRIASGFGRSRPLPAADRLGLDYLIETDVTSEADAIQWLRSHVQTEEPSHV